MAVVPRPLLIALVACVLAAAAFYATRGGASPPPSTPSATDQAPKPSGSSKQNVTALKPTDKTAPKTPSKPAAKSAQPKDERTPAKSKPKARPKARPVSVEARVSRALGHKVVVVFFRQKVGADDSAVAAAVRSVSGTRGVAVFRDGIVHLRRYPRLINGLGISQAPAVVVIGKDRQAHVVEGYVDSGSLRQQIADAR